MTWLTFRNAARAALVIGVVLLAACAVWALLRVMAIAPSDATGQRIAILSAVIGAVGVAPAIFSSTLQWREHRSRDRRWPDIVTVKLREEDRLINRSPEMHEIVEHLNKGRVVGCYGPRGAGKTFLLEHIADVVNGYRPPAPGQEKPKRIAAALYFDLTDVEGFTTVREQICRSVVGDADATWEDFILCVDRLFGRRRVLLILDNANAEGLWLKLGEAAYKYTSHRRNDRVVFGSVNPINPTLVHNLQTVHVQVKGLDLEATGELVSSRGVSMTCEELIELHDESRGLPFWVALLSTYGRGTRAAHGTAVIERMVLTDLPAETRQLLAYMSLIALVDRRISVSELQHLPIPNVEEQLTIAENHTPLTPLPEQEDQQFKIHDIVRDHVLASLEEVEGAARLLFERAVERRNFDRAALFAMFADPEQIGTARLDELLELVLHNAIRTRNYALLGSLHARARERARILNFLAGSSARGDLFCFARATELAGLGHYTDAEKELLQSNVVRTRWTRGARATELEANLRFLQADVAHLLNRYDESADMFEELGEWAAANDRRDLEARCVWGHGHVLRHQGRDLDRALALLDLSADLSKVTGNLFVKAYSVCNANGIKILTNDVPDDQEERLSRIEDEIAINSTHDGYLLEVWKTQAQLAWWRGDAETAMGIVEASIGRALEVNDRLLYNLHFERAEFRRRLGQPVGAIEDYKLVLDFGTSNGDRNLVTNALLGLVLAEIAGGRRLHHRTVEEARASTLRAREVALQADIQLTAQIAGEVTGMLDGEGPSPDDVRLFLL